MSVRTRFAPSPTGYLHIGGVRTALFNWLLSRQSGGQFLLRIDDTDQNRNVAAALQPILDGFRWLGIDWDEGPTDDGQGSRGPCGPYFQSQRLDAYQKAVDKLLESGAAYRDYAFPEETQALREAAEKEKRDFIYDRRWMAETGEQASRFEAEGRKAVIRLKMPREGKCEFNDLIRGPVSFDWAGEQDHVVQRNDGTCLYHLASVVDDEDFRITHVVRAIEHLSNTPRQIFIARSLGYQLPEYAHIPFVAEPGSKTKLSKRKIEKYLKNAEFRAMYEHGVQIARRIGIPETPESFNPVLVEFYRAVGYLPDAILNYLLLLGWSLDDHTEMFTREEMTRLFSLDRVVRNEASFDPARLMAFQARYMAALDLETKTAMCQDFLVRAGVIDALPSEEDRRKVGQIVRAAGDRLVVAGDILQFDGFFKEPNQLVFDEKAFEKRLVKAESARGLLERFRKELERATEWEATSLETRLNSWCDSQNVKTGEVIPALRVSVTGQATGFGLFDSLQILGQARTLARIDFALQRTQTPGSTG